MSEGSRGGRSYWSKYRSIKRSVRRQVEDLQEDSVKLARENVFSENIANQDTPVQRKFTCHSLISTSTKPVECNENTNSPDQCNTESSLISESDLCEIDDTVVTHSDDTLNVPMEAAEVLILDSDTESEQETENIENKSVLTQLQEWATTNQVSNTSLGGILKIFRPYHPELPKDPRTLLKTRKQYDIFDLAGGQYHHFGLLNCVISRINKMVMCLPDDFCFNLQINIDGLPLFKSTQHQFWPILGSVRNIENREPFIIGLFFGLKKPDNVSDFLQRFLDEFLELRDNGIEVGGKTLRIKLHSVICDTPARAFVKCVKLYSGYYGCDKCTQSGRWCGKMTYPETDAPLRTDESFINIVNDGHQTGRSPFLEIGAQMVSDFPIDYMHLVCLGVMKRMLLLWIKGPLTCRIGSQMTEQISLHLVNLSNHIPSDFARKPRALKDIDRWKATEMRQFLLYTGIVVLKNTLHINMYKNFLMLSVGIHILLNESLGTTYNGYAHELLVAFVKHFCEMYGNENAVYNIHGLVHLAKQAQSFGSLDNISSFPYENYLSKLKRMVRKPEFPLQQIIRRLSEQVFIEKDAISYPVLKGAHMDGPLLDSLINGDQFKSVSTQKYKVKVNGKDNCCRVDGKICLINNIVKKDDDVFLVLKTFKQKKSFFTYPLDSTLLGIAEVSQLDVGYRIANLYEIQAKCVLLPYKGKYVAFPFSDAVWSACKFVLVEFTDEKEIEVVPYIWLKEGEKTCRWPPFRSSQKIQVAVKQCIFPSSDFKELPVKVLYRTDDYLKARKKLSDAEFTSDIQTEAEEIEDGKRKKRPNRRYVESSDESEEDQPPKRKSPKKSQAKRPEPPVLQPPVLPILSAEMQQEARAITPPLPSLQSIGTSSMMETTSSRTSAFEVKLLTTLEKVRTQVYQNTKLLQLLLEKVEAPDESSVHEQLPVEVHFPIANREELDNLEDQLDNADVLNRVVKELGSIGGENLKTTVRRVLSHTIGKELAMKINWVGKGDKIPFKNLRLRNVLIRSVRKNRFTSAATDAEVENVAKDWFRFAKDRHGGRKERERKKIAEIERAHNEDENRDST